MAQENKRMNINRDIPKKKKSTDDGKKHTVSRNPKMNNNEKNSKKSRNIKREPNISQNVQQANRNGKNNVSPKMNIHEQTVSKRRNAREKKRINPNSPEVKAMPRRAQNYKIKKKKKGLSRIAVAYLLRFLLVFVVVASVVSLVFFVNLITAEPFEYETVRLKLGSAHELEDTRGVVIDIEKYFIDGVMYVNMSAIADEFDFVLTGDNKEYRYITDVKSGEEVRFYLNERIAKVNGDTVNFSGNVFKSEGSLFVPAEFFEKYVKGVTFEYKQDEKNESLAYIIISRDSARNDTGRFVESDIEFKMKFDNETIHVDELDLTPIQSALTFFKTGSVDGSTTDTTVQN